MFASLALFGVASRGVAAFSAGSQLRSKASLASRSFTTKPLQMANVLKLTDPQTQLLDQVDVFIFDCDGVIWRVGLLFLVGFFVLCLVVAFNGPFRSYSFCVLYSFSLRNISLYQIGNTSNRTTTSSTHWQQLTTSSQIKNDYVNFYPYFIGWFLNWWYSRNVGQIT